MSNITTIKEEGSPFPGSKTDDVNGFFASNKSSKSNENFFDLNGNEDIWGPQFLREGNKVVETTPFSPDLNVETIGGAYVDVERSIPLNRGVRTISRSGPNSLQVDSSLLPISGSAAEFERIRELERKVEDLEAARWKAPSIPRTIDQLLLGKPCSLSWYKTMGEKKALMDAAVATNEGNCIMAVNLFIKKTVDESIFLNMLERCPVASQHYANFLKKQKNWKELRTLYRRLSDYDNLGYFSIQECEAPGLDVEEQVKRIKSCPVQFKNLHLKQAEDIQHVEEYSRLVNKQLKIEEATGASEKNVLFTPLTTTLLYCLKNHRGQERSTGNPEELRRLFNIPDRQFFQMDVLALALRKDWKGVNALLTSKGVMGFGKKKKSPIGFERVVRLLGQKRFRAPDSVLTEYLEEVDDLEQRYKIAMDVEVYDAALQTLKTLRDKERIQSFINHLPVHKHYEFRNKVDKILSNSQIKWK